jgi:hypothetical protein
MDDWHFPISSPAFKLIMAGAMGGVVKWLTLREDWRDGLISIVLGAVMAYYVNPLALPILEPTLGRIVVDHEAFLSLSGFIVGIGGITLSGMLIDIVRGMRRKANQQHQRVDVRRHPDGYQRTGEPCPGDPNNGEQE